MLVRSWHAFTLGISLVMVLQATPVRAGTTGQLTGVVTKTSDGAPISGVNVTAAGPSQVATAVTDASGHFVILDLIPDTYVVSFEKPSYTPVTIDAVPITADAARSLTQTLTSLATIGHVSTRSPSNLLRAGSTSDVYSIDSLTQFKSSLAGGGALANSAYSALATIPGVFVAPDQMGYDPNVSIRGGSPDQVGFEIDGIPLNRAFDNYPSGSESTLGQQELQVYVGGEPATAGAQGLSGLVNQVIRTGTTPGFTSLSTALGGAGYYHNADFETGGETTNRNFSYYLGIGGFDQTFRFGDNFNGRGVGQLYGAPIAPCVDVGVAIAPSCYVNGKFAGTGVNAYNYYFDGEVSSFVLGTPNLFGTSELIDRDSVINLHLRIPHKNGLKDDFQFLGTTEFLKTYFYDSTNDLGGAKFLAETGYSDPTGVPYSDGFAFNSPTGVFLPSNYQQLASRYLFAGSPANRALNGNDIPPNLQDNNANNQGIAKLAYSHPFSENALLKIYGYTYYSNWLENGPQSAYADFLGATAPDYMLSTHTRGVSASFVDQVNSQNLLRAEGSFTTASSLRDNDLEYEDGFGYRRFLGYVVDGSNPADGLCYGYTGGVPVSCFSSGAGTATLAQAYYGSITPVGGTCGGGPCNYLVTGNGSNSTVNAVTPRFYVASVTDEFKPTAKLSLAAGLRTDIFQFQGAVTNGGIARTFFYNAFNRDFCIDAAQNLVPKMPTDACPAGTTAPGLQNPTGRVTETYTEFQPRLGLTYALDRATLVRASFGRFAQAPNAAFEQYNFSQPNALTQLYLKYGFQKVGFKSPDHDVRPQISNNYDLSIEHELGREMSLKASPFYRTTQDQIQDFFLSEQNLVVTGLNVGRQTSRGVEFEFDAGNFARDGLAARLSATYTNSFIRYDTLPFGGTLIDTLNSTIASYNAYTSACAASGKLTTKAQYGSAVCGSIASGAAASPCYSAATSAADGSSPASGVAEPCSTPGAVANPYWNAPAQGLIDPKGNYATYPIIPSIVGSSANAYGAPYFGSLVLNYKHGPLALTPLVTLTAGQRYGAPESTYGVNPELCGGLAGFVPGDPRYPYGTAGGAGFDATSTASLANGCASGFVIPNPYTRRFDAIGAFAAPAMAQVHLQISYDASKNMQIVAGFANLLTECFGGSKEPWNVAGACGYTVVAGGSTGDVGNQYNPGAVIQPYLNTPYSPTFAPAPFAFGIGAKVKL